MGNSHSIYVQRLNDVIDLIDRDYMLPLLLEQLADHACFSPYHFHRLFREYVGDTPAAFVRKVRLHRALRLIESRPNPRLGAIALECGFAQASDFTRAFREEFGYPPSKHKIGLGGEESKNWQDIRMNSRYGFHGGIEMESQDNFQVRIEELSEQRMAYVRVLGGAFDPDALMAALKQLLDWGRCQGIYPGATLASISRDNPEIVPPSEYRLDLCMFVPKHCNEVGDVSFATLPSRRYALIHCLGDIHKVQRAWTYLYRRWLPASGFEPADAPNIELFLNSDDSNGWTTLDLDCGLPIRPLQH